MSLGSTNMAGGPLGMASSLLLLVSIIQGLRGVEVIHHKRIVAEEGQNVTLPCVVKHITGLHIVSIEWSKKNMKENTKLAVYNPNFPINLIWPNVTIEINSMGSYLCLSGVSKWDSGIYICDLTTFPHGSIMSQTELEIKDPVKIMCDANGTVEVNAGENVTIHCRALPNADYSWTKNEKLVSGNTTLELLRVTAAYTGVYTLAVNTGNRSLHKDFIITVLTATTSFRTDIVTEEGITESADIDNTTSLTTGPSNTDTSVPWSTSMVTDVMGVNPNPSNVTDNTPSSSVTTTPATHTDLMNTTHSLNKSSFSDHSVASNLSATLSHASTVFKSTQEPRNESNPGTTPTQSTGNTIDTDSEDEGTDGVRSHLWLVLIMVLMLVLIAVSGFLYRRRSVKKRMDLPPPFKPPPPPVKYTAISQRGISTQHFPTGRCDSVTESHQMFIHI